MILKLRGAPALSTPAVGTQPRVILKLRGARAPIFEQGTRAAPSVDELMEQHCGAEADAFWSAAEARLPKSAAYLHKLVPQCARDLAGCVLVAPADRTEWFMCLGEMVSLCEEATRRHGAALDLRPTPQAMPVAYLAERLDTDEPLWGWHVRDEANGWMQGFITLTTFTTWSATFEFNATRAESGLPAARLQNALARSGQMTSDPTLYTAKNDDLVKDIAAAHGLTNAQLLELNRDWFPEMKPSHRLMKGTILRVESSETADLDKHPLPDDTPAKVAARHMLPLDDLLVSNAARFDGVALEADTPLGGRAMLLRDRENEVEMPQIGARKAKARRHGEGADDGGGGGAVLRRVDDGTLTRALAAVEHSGDPRTSGVVWGRIAEVGEVCALGCGGAVLRAVLRRLQSEAKYSHVVLQATLPAVGFYEGLGFVRVGAVAQYAPVGADLSTFPVTGYRHWMAPDELMAEQFGETSYLMALELAAWRPAGEVPTPRIVGDYPEITPMEQARGRDLRRHQSLEGGVQQCFESSDGVVVSLVPRPHDGAASLGRFRGEDLRMEVRYEVDAVIARRGEGSELEYQVRWKVFPTPSWEPAANLEGSQAAIRAFEKRSGAAARKGANTAAGAAASSSSDVGGATGKAAAARPKKPKPVLWWEQLEGFTPPPIRATNYALGTEGKGPDGRVWRVVQVAGGGRMHWAPCRDGKLEQAPKKQQQHSERQKQKKRGPPPDAATSADAAVPMSIEE